MSNALDEILGEALNRKRQQCSHETTYTHENIKQWLESAISEDEIDWKVVVPVFQSSEEENKALSDWPNVKLSKKIQNWLDKKKCIDSKDLIDGACDPLALYLSISIMNSIQEGTFKDLFDSNTIARKCLEAMKPLKAAELVFDKFIDQKSRGPLLWDPNLDGSYIDYLFGTDTMKTKINSSINSESSLNFMPLYVLNYLFDTNELTNEELKRSTQESAQYSCHAIGLVFDRTNRRILIADPNGPLIPGSNMEFVKVPLMKRSDPSTQLSCYDKDKVNLHKRRKLC